MKQKSFLSEKGQKPPVAATCMEPLALYVVNDGNDDTEKVSLRSRVLRSLGSRQKK